MIKNGWYCCPHCNKKLFTVGIETKIFKLPYKCKACKFEFEISIPDQEPRAIEPRADFL